MAAIDDWNGIRLFLAIAQGGSLNQAARELGVNHSTVFRRLNTLEDGIGGRLFERFGNGYQMTALGERVLPIAGKIADCFDQLDREVVGQDVQPRGVIKLTAPSNIAYHFLPGYLAKFNERYPDIHIEVLASNLTFNMNTRQADIAVRATTSPPEHLVGRKIGAVGWSVFAGKSYLQSRARPTSLADLSAHRLIGATGTLRSLTGFIWLENNLARAIYSRCDDLIGMSYLAEAGQGLALLPNDQARPALEMLLAVEPAGKSDFWILTHPELRNVTRINLLMRFLSDHFVDFRES